MNSTSLVPPYAEHFHCNHLRRFKAASSSFPFRAISIQGSFSINPKSPETTIICKFYLFGFSQKTIRSVKAPINIRIFTFHKTFHLKQAGSIVIKSIKSVYIPRCYGDEVITSGILSGITCHTFFACILIIKL